LTVQKFESKRKKALEAQNPENVRIRSSTSANSDIFRQSQEFLVVSSTEKSSQSTEEIDCEPNGKIVQVAFTLKRLQTLKIF